MQQNNISLICKSPIAVQETKESDYAKRTAYNFPSSVQFWIKSGIVPVNWLSLIRLQINRLIYIHIYVSESPAKYALLYRRILKEVLQIGQCFKFGECTWDVATQVVRAKKPTKINIVSTLVISLKVSVDCKRTWTMIPTVFECLVDSRALEVIYLKSG